MNKEVIWNILGKIWMINGSLLLIPIFVSLVYQESWLTILSFAIPGVLGLLSGYLLQRTRPSRDTIYTKESLIIVALTWISVSFFGALPFMISGSIPSFINAYFEAVSGFTTTGSSIVENVEALPHSILFWRSFMHLIGGMGILVFVLAVFPKTKGQDVKIMQAEVPGPTFGKLTSKLSYTARSLYGLYLLFFLIMVFLLRIAGMPWFDSIIHAFGTAGTGGFGMKSSSIAHYDSSLINYLLSFGMLFFSVNFNLYYYFIIQKERKALFSEELRNFLLIVVVATGLITINILPTYGNLFKASEEAFFSVTSLISTTGFSVFDYNHWPHFSKLILFIVMFIGGCAGSTAGGLKVSRVSIYIKTFIQRIRNYLSPHQVIVPAFENKAVDEGWVRDVINYLLVYLGIFILLVLAISWSLDDLPTTFSAVSATLNNVGPGFSTVGPASNFNGMTDWNKLILTFSMLIGRLELFPILILFHPKTWKKY